MVDSSAVVDTETLSLTAADDVVEIVLVCAGVLVTVAEQEAEEVAIDDDEAVLERQCGLSLQGLEAVRLADTTSLLLPVWVQDLVRVAVTACDDDSDGWDDGDEERDGIGTGSVCVAVCVVAAVADGFAVGDCERRAVALAARDTTAGDVGLGDATRSCGDGVSDGAAGCDVGPGCPLQSHCSAATKLTPDQSKRYGDPEAAGGATRPRMNWNSNPTVSLPVTTLLLRPPPPPLCAASR